MQAHMEAFGQGQCQSWIGMGLGSVLPLAGLIVTAQHQHPGHPSTSFPGKMPIPAPSGCVQLAVAVEVCEVQWPWQQRCGLGAQRPAEPLADPSTALVPGGDSSCWDRAEGKVSAPVTKVDGHPVVPVVLSTVRGHAATPRAEITLVGL